MPPLSYDDWGVVARSGSTAASAPRKVVREAAPAATDEGTLETDEGDDEEEAPPSGGDEDAKPREATGGGTPPHATPDATMEPRLRAGA